MVKPGVSISPGLDSVPERVTWTDRQIDLFYHIDINQMVVKGCYGAVLSFFAFFISCEQCTYYVLYLVHCNRICRECLHCRLLI